MLIITELDAALHGRKDNTRDIVVADFNTPIDARRSVFKVVERRGQ